MGKYFGFFRFKMILPILAVLMLAFSAATGEESAVPTIPPPPETPVPARPHVTPEPGPDYPVIVDRTADPYAWPGFRFRLDAKLLDIWFPNIMNADETILLYEGETWLIDCGDVKMGSRGAELLKKLGVQQIDRLFNTHPHHDHLNGLSVTHQAVPVKEILFCFGPESTEHITKAISYAESNGIRISEFREGDTFSMGGGDVSLKCFVNTDPALDMNNQSAVMLLSVGERRMLFTADMEKPGQVSLLARVPVAEIRAEILKYPHHGKSALDGDFLEAVNPSLAVVTNLRVDWEGVRYLAGKQIPTLFTNQSGVYLHLQTDGEHWLAELVPADQVQ